MELLPDGRFLLRVGIGWKHDFVGKQVVGGEKGSQAGYTLLSGMPVIVKDFRVENRFEKPEILKVHGVASGASVVIGSKENIFGVLVVNSTKRRKFTPEDTYFLTSVAFLIAQVVERKNAEEALRESEEKYRELFESSVDGIVVTDLAGNILKVNPAYEKMLGYSMEELQHLSYQQLTPAWWHESEAHIVREQVFELGYSDEYEKEYIRKDGSIFPISIRVRLSIDKKGQPQGMWGIVRDITERKKIEEALLESEASRKVAEAVKVERQRFYNVLETLPAMICLLTHDCHIVFANCSYRKKFGKSGGLHCYESRFGHTQPCEFCESYKVFETGQIHNWKVTTPDGSVIDTYEVPFTDFDGTPMILKMDIDITERKEAEEALEKIERVRVKEIHHRIKNNLQVISSLLDLQADKFTDENVIEAFREGQNRVISMSLIHEELYKGGENDKLDFSAYLKKLAESLFQTYSLSSKNVRLSMDLEDNAFLDIDTAVPLGIIVNELISNSLKHAFTKGEEGKIRINLSKEEGSDTSFTLSISDNGVGIPESIDIEVLDSLGLQLVTTLVEQLDGELELKRDTGTEFTVRFTVTEKIISQLATIKSS